MSEEIEVASHSDEDQPEVFKDDSQEFDVREAFGLPAKVENDEDSDDGEKSVNDKTPAKEDAKAESTKRVVKFNKEDREIDESEVDELLQKGLGLDQERARTKQREGELDRTAKLLGFKDHAELTANLDSLEKKAVQDQKDQFEQSKQKIIDDMIYNGVDEQAARDYAENNPLVKQAKEAIAERETAQAEQDKARNQQAYLNKWQELYDAYPTIVEDSKAFTRNDSPKFYTDEMKARIAKGIDPIDAYELTHKAEIKNRVTKSAEQKAIKDLQLGNRSKVETIDRGTQENQASEELRGAFSMFGIDPKRAQKYAK